VSISCGNLVKIGDFRELSRCFWWFFEKCV